MKEPTLTHRIRKDIYDGFVWHVWDRFGKYLGRVRYSMNIPFNVPLTEGRPYDSRH